MYALCISSNIHKNDEVFTSCCWLLDWQEDGLHIWMIKQVIARYCKSLLESQVVGSKILQLEEKSHVDLIQNMKHQGRCVPGWWFGTFFIFHNIRDKPSHWLIFFKMIKTTNQMCSVACFLMLSGSVFILGTSKKSWLDPEKLQLTHFFKTQLAKLSTRCQRGKNGATAFGASRQWWSLW